ncbi:hypothetical protein TNCV_2627151 [Trichonephila clavipes]|uniref:Tc1-like transposase DDE domain-containing protein n=1 Tax=Trichonephila clavipes TaxID=2585209 RepID=A0A8X6W7H0_TRICX|nr:hypothetical protein TNCV_2627151 [Trichonephila clavipes]
MEWPARSPDLNPIEHLWDYLGREVAALNPPQEKESENENEETKLIRNHFAHYVGTPIDADLREQILKLGPYQPEGQKIERKWLCYSTRLHVAYCQNLRNKFANIKEETIGLAKKWSITPEFEKKRHRKVRQFFDDFNADEKLQDRERLFEVDVFKANVDVITIQLKKIAMRV